MQEILKGMSRLAAVLAPPGEIKVEGSVTVTTRRQERQQREAALVGRSGLISERRSIDSPEESNPCIPSFESAPLYCGPMDSLSDSHSCVPGNFWKSILDDIIFRNVLLNQ